VTKETAVLTVGPALQDVEVLMVYLEDLDYQEIQGRQDWTVML